jgi:hypothetical protein
MLRQLVADTGRNASETANLLGCSPSMMSRLFSGKRVPSPVELSTLLAVCGVVGRRRRDEILALADNALTPIWWQDYGSGPPKYRHTLADNESIATTITIYENSRVPELLQAPAYTRELLRALPKIPADEIDDRVAELSRRQRVLDHRHPPALRVYLNEHAMARPSGHYAATSEQTDHLLRMTTRRGIHVHVVPESVGVRYPTPFTLLHFAAQAPVVYHELPTSALFLEDETTIAAYQRIIEDLDRWSLNEDDSRTWLASDSMRRGAYAGPVAQLRHDDRRLVSEESV